MLKAQSHLVFLVLLTLASTTQVLSLPVPNFNFSSLSGGLFRSAKPTVTPSFLGGGGGHVRSFGEMGGGGLSAAPAHVSVPPVKTNFNLPPLRTSGMTPVRPVSPGTSVRTQRHDLSNGALYGNAQGGGLALHGSERINPLASPRTSHQLWDDLPPSPRTPGSPGRFSSSDGAFRPAHSVRQTRSEFAPSSKGHTTTNWPTNQGYGMGGGVI